MAVSRDMQALRAYPCWMALPLAFRLFLNPLTYGVPFLAGFFWRKGRCSLCLGVLVSVGVGVGVGVWVGVGVGEGVGV